jgi:DNA-binding response OmpR family regulator
LNGSETVSVANWPIHRQAEESKTPRHVLDRNHMGKTILIADDDGDLVELLRQSFTQAGFSTVAATNGIEALKMARSLSPDLIVLDVNMPEMNGFTVCETLRSEGATVGIPIVMLTGLVGQLGRAAGLAGGADDYVMKPVAVEHLISRIQRLLQDAPEDSEKRKRASAPSHERGTTPQS